MRREEISFAPHFIIDIIIYTGSRYQFTFAKHGVTIILSIGKIAESALFGQKSETREQDSGSYEWAAAEGADDADG